MLKPGHLIMPRGTGNNRIIAPGFLSGLVPFTRSQSSVVTTAPDSSGAQVQYSANVPRFIGASRGLLMEGQRTNAITNPRCVGAVAGTPGTMPTNWGTSIAGGLTRSVVGSGTENGIDYVDIRVFGTTSNAGLFLNLGFDSTPNAPALTVGQNLAMSVYCALVGGSMPPGGLKHTITALDASRISLSSWPQGPQFNPTSTLTRYSSVVAATHASTAFAIPGIWSSFQSGLAVDFTLRFGWPQAEANVPHSSSIILPLAGTTGASTRGNDLINEPFIEAFPSSMGTVLGRTTLDTFTSIGQSIFQVDDGTLSNRLTVYNDPNNGNLQVSSFKAGASNSSYIGVLAAGTPFNWGMTFNGTNIISTFNSNAPMTNTNYPNSLNRILVNGISTGSSNSMFGTHHRLEFLPYAVSSSQLQSLVANIPT